MGVNVSENVYILVTCEKLYDFCRIFFVFDFNVTYNIVNPCKSNGGVLGNGSITPTGGGLVSGPTKSATPPKNICTKFATPQNFVQNL